MSFLRKKAGERQAKDLSRLLEAARRGEAASREELLVSYQPFVLRVAAAACGRYLSLGEDDEASIALIAFQEAIDRFNPEKGAGFLTFAELVIRRRLIDQQRREARQPQVVPLQQEESWEDESPGPPVEAKQSLALYRAGEEARDRREEIKEYSLELAAYGITLAELTRISPKHRDARERALFVARELAARQEWLKELTARKELPLKELAAATGVPRKTLERNRRYILAVVLLLSGDYPFLKSYITESGG